ncbi:MAG: glycosyltransferase [Gemmatimonadota bacterium]|nr:glycosyltransferase [Gemmatimonadota bacterium]
MARIVTVYRDSWGIFQPVEMGAIRWLKISEALARCGHSVDIATNETFPPDMERAAAENGLRLRTVPLRDVRWSDYDVVKTLFDLGFQTLEAYGGAAHPFIISKLGSVVDARDREGIYFYGAYREELYAIQERINACSRYVTVLSEGARELWMELFGPKPNILLVPGAADRDIPALGDDPFPPGPQTRVLFAGNVYTCDYQGEANDVLVAKLNELGELLRGRGCLLYMIGVGDVSRLDPECVTYLGFVSHEQAWNFFGHAHVGIVVSAGSFMHNNESTKIYHYLRAGLPVVSESGFPNDDVVRRAGLGFVVDSGDMPAMARRIEEAARATWDRAAAVNYMVENHTWDTRVAMYDRLLQQHSL